MNPTPYRVVSSSTELNGVVTLELEPVDTAIPLAQPGQFAMLYVPGFGESAISYSRIDGDKITHTIRGVGGVSNALIAKKVGDIIGVRGPFGMPWPVEVPNGGDLLIVAGGLGLAPLRPVLDHVILHRENYEKISLVAGARNPASFLFLEEILKLKDLDVHVTVDAADKGWRSNVGVVTRILDQVMTGCEGHAFVCGPELMMKFTALGLVAQGYDPARIFLSMERAMHCGIGICGHCQLGPYLICRDGPVMSFDRLKNLMEIREL